MKTTARRNLILSFSTFAMLLALGFTNVSFGQEVTNSSKLPYKHGFKKFRRGVCVGQTLAQEGIILPPHQPGQKPTLDPATQAAFRAAVQSCRAQFKGTGQSNPTGTNPPTTTGSGTSS